jgi:acetyl-CoA carboxylase biotin carboxyl carrier protein
MTTFEQNPVFTEQSTDADDVRELVTTVQALLAALPDRPEQLRLRLRDASVELTWPSLPVAATHAEAALPILEQAIVAAPTAPPAPATPPDATQICAPSVGTFHRSAEPGAAPFVNQGDVVKPGQQVGIVEAMKLMLPVEAEQSGRVSKVLVGDGEPVEYGAALFALTPIDN